MRLPQRDTDLAYLAGIIDGEGSIFRRVPLPRRKWGVEVANTDVGLIEWLAGLGGRVRVEHRIGGRTVYHWQVYARRDMVELLTAVRPYMRIKAARAGEALGELLALERMA